MFFDLPMLTVIPFLGAIAALLLIGGLHAGFPGDAELARPSSLLRQRLTTTRLVAVVALATFAMVQARAQSETPARPVVFVCDHGSVKSLVAALFFDRMAAERGLVFRSVSRGISPDATVPPKIADALHAEGFDVSGYKPAKLTQLDLKNASHVIAIGVDRSSPGALQDPDIVSWDDIPPASVNFAASKAALQQHIDELLDQLAATSP
jgi:arsenate reductase (thioredoxin)